MITTVVFCPQPLFLLPEYAGGTPVEPALREACAAAVRDLRARADGIVVVTTAGPATTSREPAGLRVARELLGATRPADAVVVADDLPPAACRARGRALAAQVEETARGRTGLLVTADGSARRGEKAPGHLDERAFAYDDAFVAAVGDGDVAALAALEARPAADLLFQGRAALQVGAGAVEELTPSRSTIFYRDDPFGVMYVVAEWLLD